MVTTADSYIERVHVKIQESQAAQLALLGGIVLVAAVLRFYKLGEWSFWYDEVFTINRTTAHFSGWDGMWERPFPSIIWFPVSLILTGQVFNSLGVDEFTARLIPALFGLLAIPAIYACARWLFGAGVGLLSAAILAVTPSHLFWSQNARFYTALMLFVMLALFAFFYAFERNRPGFIILGYGLFYLAVSERLTALLAFPSLLIYLLLVYLFRLEKGPGYNRRNLLLVLAPYAGFVVLELFLMVTTGDSFMRNVAEVFGVNRGPSPFRLAYRIVLDMGVLLSILMGIGGLYLLLTKQRAGFFLVSFALSPILALLLLNPFMFTDERYVFMILPAWIILAAVAMRETAVRLNHAPQRILFALALPLLLLLSNAFTDMRYYQSNQGHRLDWRGAVALVADQAEDEDLVATNRNSVADYYLKQETALLDLMQPVDVMQSKQRYWLIVDDYAEWSARNVTIWAEQNCELKLAEQLLLERPQSLRVYLCDPERIAGQSR